MVSSYKEKTLFSKFEADVLKSSVSTRIHIGSTGEGGGEIQRIFVGQKLRFVGSKACFWDMTGRMMWPNLKPRLKHLNVLFPL